MKRNLLLLFSFMMLTSISMGQRMKDEIQIVNPLLQLVPLSEVQDFKAYQERYFKNPRTRLATLIIDENTHSQYYRLKDSHDIVGIGTIQNEESTSDWEGLVKGVGRIRPTNYVFDS